MAVPIAVMTVVGHPDIGYQAATGAFAALYASNRAAIDRVRVVPVVGAGLFAAAALGVWAGSSPLLTILGLALVTLAASAAAFGFSLGPPGPLFAVLIFGLSAHVSSVGAPAGVYLAAVAGGILLSILITAAPLVLASRRRMPRHPLRELLPGPSWSGPAGMLFLRAAIVALVGTALGIAIDPDRVYWIVGAAIAVIGTAAERQAAFHRGLHRMVGTLVGVVLYLLVAPVPITGIALALVLGGLQFAIEIVVVRNYALALTFITPLVLLLTSAATGVSGSIEVASERVIDTLVGATLGAITGLLHSRAARR
ncbi:FUSC family protein [Microbacterium sp. 4R-513]|nr:FUSC family protein [Microbacterium sp. 4R-513]